MHVITRKRGGNKVRLIAAIPYNLDHFLCPSELHFTNVLFHFARA